MGKHGINELAVLQDKAWFLGDLSITPQDANSRPILDKIYETKSQERGKEVVAADYAKEVATVMEDLEQNISTH